jgi:hypothetical protein
MECSKVSLARSRADMEDQTSIKSYPLPVAVWIIRQLVEELVSFRRRASNLLVEWHGLLARRAEQGKSAGFLVVSFCQFQGATGLEAPSHGCRAARLLCALV